MRSGRFVRDNGLTLAFLLLFVLSLVAQAFAGWRLQHSESLAHGASPPDFWGYVFSSEFGAAVSENWQSEFMQFSAFILLSVWLVQRGSTESKEPDKAGPESDKDQRMGRYATPDSPEWAGIGGWRQTLYGNSLILVMTLFWVLSWLVSALTAWRVFNEDQQWHESAAVGFWSYLGRPDFWERTMQNWQSEFIAVATLLIFTVFLRQRGSAQSKPVGAPHLESSTSG